MAFYNPNPSCQVKNISQIYEKVFGYKCDGTFVEVGAYDGEEFSNTNFLSDIGWSGIYIEPYQPVFEKCLNRHKENNVNVINCAIGTVEGEIDLYRSYTDSGDETKDSYMTSTNFNQTQIIPQFGWSSNFRFNQLKCNQYTLERILKENNIPKNFDILVVDVEGNETDVLNSFSIEEWKPKMMIIELVDYNENYQQFPESVASSELRKKIINYGYKEVYADDINTIFIDEDIPY